MPCECNLVESDHNIESDYHNIEKGIFIIIESDHHIESDLHIESDHNIESDHHIESDQCFEDFL